MAKTGEEEHSVFGLKDGETLDIYSLAAVEIERGAALLLTYECRKCGLRNFHVIVELEDETEKPEPVSNYQVNKGRNIDLAGEDEDDL